MHFYQMFHCKLNREWVQICQTSERKSIHSVCFAFQHFSGPHTFPTTCVTFITLLGLSCMKFMLCIFESASQFEIIFQCFYFAVRKLWSLFRYMEERTIPGLSWDTYEELIHTALMLWMWMIWSWLWYGYIMDGCAVLCRQSYHTHLSRICRDKSSSLQPARTAENQALALTLP